jgi:hypothetical protein
MDCSSSTSSRPAAVHGALPAALVAVLIGGGLACYTPTVLDGGYRCGSGVKACPDGFTCDTATMTCRQIGGGGDAGASDRPSGSDGRSDAGGDAACVPPPPLCTPQQGTALCDPVCQDGCGCNQKCSSNTAGTLTCNMPLALGTRAVGQSCDIQAPGTTQQTDSCAAGLVCVADSCQGQSCYRFCVTDQDCPNSTCSRDAGGGVKICDVPFVTCDPLPGQPSDCPATGQGCYLSSTMADRTLCTSCPGGVVANAGCTLSRDCLPGLVCVDATNINDFRCRRVCSLQGGGGGCNNGLTCRSVGGSRMYGYCF